jgi:hypothetical protein
MEYSNHENGWLLSSSVGAGGRTSSSRTLELLEMGAYSGSASGFLKIARTRSRTVLPSMESIPTSLERE